jgi:prepilin-type N-terminal cleavage/methylation domain-containing protein
MLFCIIIKNKKAGFSLLELVLAIAIFSFSSFVLASLLIEANINTRFNTEKIEALTYAKEGIEAVEFIRNNNWSNIQVGEHGLLNEAGVWSFSGSTDTIENKYIRKVTITERDPVSTSTKNILVNITWSLTPLRSVSVNLETVLANWK